MFVRLWHVSWCRWCWYSTLMVSTWWTESSCPTCRTSISTCSSTTLRQNTLSSLHRSILWPSWKKCQSWRGWATSTRGSCCRSTPARLSHSCWKCSISSEPLVYLRVLCCRLVCSICGIFVWCENRFLFLFERLEEKRLQQLRTAFDLWINTCTLLSEGSCLCERKLRTRFTCGPVGLSALFLRMAEPSQPKASTRSWCVTYGSNFWEATSTCESAYMFTTETWNVFQIFENRNDWRCVCCQHNMYNYFHVHLMENQPVSGLPGFWVFQWERKTYPKVNCGVRCLEKEQWVDKGDKARPYADHLPCCFLHMLHCFVCLVGWIGKNVKLRQFCL